MQNKHMREAHGEELKLKKQMEKEISDGAKSLKRERKEKEKAKAKVKKQMEEN